ncbi:MAG: hypothetical protein HYS06_06845 [Methylocystis sp.]|nr:hypothetical protein [Methylocystis sp.]MBI3274547.1 hypothetical protein [Methylocystis sp.]
MNKLTHIRNTRRGLPSKAFRPDCTSSLRAAARGARAFTFRSLLASGRRLKFWPHDGDQP